MNELLAAVNHFENQLELMRHYAEDYPDNDYTAITDIYATALAALREKAERERGCEYCEKEKRIKNACYTNAFAEVCKHSKSFAVHMPLNFGSADCDFFINYCPMCGRKLEDEK